MQPYFFPYIGHFALIASVDQWIVFDVTQYTPKTWMNRNRILHPSDGWQYVTVPLANSSRSIKTSEAKILDPEKTKKSIEGKLSHYRKKAPYYDAVLSLVGQAFDSLSGDSLVRLNTNGLRVVCEYLRIQFSSRVCSEMNIPFPENLGPGDWAPYICEHVGAAEYVNPVRGRELFDPARFARSGVTLSFASVEEFSYDTSPYQYQPHLSILDVLMWNPPDMVANALKAKTTLIRA